MMNVTLCTGQSEIMFLTLTRERKNYFKTKKVTDYHVEITKVLFLQYKHVFNTGFQRGNMASSGECSTVYRLERRKAMKAYPAGEEHEYGLCYNFQNYNHFRVSSCLNVRNHINVFLRIPIWRLHLTFVEIRKKVYLISRGRTRKVRDELVGGELTTGRTH